MADGKVPDRIVTRVKSEHAPLNTSNTPPVPAALQGTLSEALVRLQQARSERERAADAPVPVSALVIENSEPWKGVRTLPQTAEALTRDVLAGATTQTPGLAQRLYDRLMGTGVFSSVDIDSRPAAAGAAAGIDVVARVAERSYSVNTGVTQSLAGKVEAYTTASLLNPLGMCEVWTATLGSTGNELSVSSMGEMFGLPGLGRSSDGPARATNAFSRVQESLSPTMTLSFQKPTFMGRTTPVSARYRSETERFHTTSGFTNQLQELEASITDPTNKHSLSYTLALRQVVPIKHPGNHFAFSASPQIVSDAISSLKSSVAYSYARSRLNSASLPSAGTRTLFRMELAGIGGDVHFLKSTASWLGAWSVGRFAPDTGYQLPLSHGEWLQRQVALSRALKSSTLTKEDVAHIEQARITAHLRPHPSGLFSAFSGGVPAAPALSAHHTPAEVLRTIGAPSGEYTWQHRLAGWLAPGITLHVDASAGHVTPLFACGRLSVVDKLFVTGTRFRGFDVIGPTALPVPGGVPSGDALGGDALAAVSARVLLPPPFPSVRLANAGLRTQLFLSVGSLLDTTTTHSLQAVLDSRSAAAGIGLVMPLGGAASVEANYTLGSYKQPTDVGATFRLQLTM